EPSNSVRLMPPARAKVLSRSVVELIVASANISEFMSLTLIRFHLESRMEKVTEAFATLNLEFPLQAVRLQLLEHPQSWTEQRFTVDTPRIINLLMGSELYGAQSKDVWFREL